MPCASSSSLSCSVSPTRSTSASRTLESKPELFLLIIPHQVTNAQAHPYALSFRTTADEGIDCLHGPSECLGNIIELCARELYPDPKISLGFVMCLTKDYKHIPERGLVEDCALEHAVDFEALNECATRDDGAYGMKLLRSSVERTAEVRT